MKPTIKTFLSLFFASAVAVLALTLNGCKHTAHGAGQDIENMGEKIKEKTN